MPMVACVWRICFADFYGIVDPPAGIGVRDAEGFACGGRR
jgi:hypothetical protein